ncbi:MAG TPA: hypothetical protein DDZ40_06305 [Deltaproteobacteria bacterium]|nr:hypothetical protein [Deltaproteobacteria bacterium]
MDNKASSAELVAQTSEAEQKRQERIAKKLRQIRDPRSMVIAPKVRDVHFLATMLYTFDKAVNNMRLNVGLRVPLASVITKRDDIAEFTKDITEYMRALGAGSYGNYYYLGGNQSVDPEQKQFLAKRHNTYVFIPSTTEGEHLANLIISLDSAFCEFKVKFPLTDLNKISEAMDHMKGLVKRCRDLVADIASLTNTRFIEPKGLATYLGEEATQRGNGKTTKKETQ